MIYFAQAEDGGPIKVGTTKQMIRRIIGLNAAYKKRHKILGIMPGTLFEEQDIHKQFSSCQTFVGYPYAYYKGERKPDGARSPEWFRPTPEILAFIAENTQSWNGEDDLARPRIMQPIPVPPPTDFVWPKYTNLTVQGTYEWKSWIQGFAESCDRNIAFVIEEALKLYADHMKHEQPPDRLSSA